MTQRGIPLLMKSVKMGAFHAGDREWHSLVVSQFQSDKVAGPTYSRYGSPLGNRFLQRRAARPSQINGHSQVNIPYDTSPMRDSRPATVWRRLVYASDLCPL